MAMLVKVSRGVVPEGARGSAPVTLKLDVGRTLALLVLGALCGVAALLLFLDDKPEAAASFVGFTSAILSGGFGLAIGEKAGAEEAVRALDNPG